MMQSVSLAFRRGAIAIALSLPTAAMAVGPAAAAECGGSATGFDGWLAKYKTEAAAQGIKPGTIASAFAGVAYDPNVIRLDRSQRSFKLSFEQFYAKRVSNALIGRGQRMLQAHQGTIQRIEQRFGVPGAVLVSIWGLETNYGSDGGGRLSIVRSIATLAYDCRRTDFFRNELISALRIIDRGDMSAEQMRGGWAGEIGQVQFLPSSYYKYAVDFDGDGRRDLVRSVPDMLASTANFLKSKGWKAGAPWGPGTANYAALQEWNKAEVYSQTIAVMANKLSGR